MQPGALSNNFNYQAMSLVSWGLLGLTFFSLAAAFIPALPFANALMGMGIGPFSAYQSWLGIGLASAAGSVLLNPEAPHNDENKKGVLSRAFDAVADIFTVEGLVKLAVISIPAFFLFGYLDNAIFDPFFFDAIHGSYANSDIDAWKGFLNHYLGFMHDFSGFTGESGLLQSDFMQSLLEPFKNIPEVLPEADEAWNSLENALPQDTSPSGF